MNVHEFANPYIACETCGARVRSGGSDLTNQPCGHRADAFSVCPSWSPVGGCQCLEDLGAVEHGTPTESVGGVIVPTC